MTKLLVIYKAIAATIKNNPALGLALVNFGVLLAAKFGLHITGDQLVYVVGVATVLIGSLTRALVTPTTKLPAVVQKAPDAPVGPVTVLPDHVPAQAVTEVLKPLPQTDVSNVVPPDHTQTGGELFETNASRFVGEQPTRATRKPRKRRAHVESEEVKDENATTVAAHVMGVHPDNATAGNDATEADKLPGNDEPRTDAS